MPKHSWLLLAALSLIVIVVLSPTQAGVQAQSPTKTPIGVPPTKPPLVEVLPTKTPLPDAPATALPTPLELPTKVPTLTPSRRGASRLTNGRPKPGFVASPQCLSWKSALRG
jgi:hypothetical protein